VFSNDSENFFALVSSWCCGKDFNSRNVVHLLHRAITMVENVSLVSYVTGYCAGIYVDMRNAKLSCCKIIGVVTLDLRGIQTLEHLPV